MREHFHNCVVCRDGWGWSGAEGQFSVHFFNQAAHTVGYRLLCVWAPQSQCVPPQTSDPFLPAPGPPARPDLPSGALRVFVVVWKCPSQLRGLWVKHQPTGAVCVLWLGGWESPRSPVRSLSFNSQANSDKTSGSSHSLGGLHSQPWCSSCRGFYEHNHTPWCGVSAHLLQHPHFGTSCLLWGQARRLAAPVPATPWCPCPGQVLVEHAGWAMALPWPPSAAMAGGHLRPSPRAGHVSLSKMSSVGGYYFFFPFLNSHFSLLYALPPWHAGP